MSQQELQIVLEFTAEDRAWIRVSKVDVPKFWSGHAVPPALGDVVRLGGRQFVIEARVWEQEVTTPVLKLYLSSSHAQSDTTFG
ncbi:MAG TPA: hypothetical protein VGM74_04560 [Burkholderiaceae bacterium]|jgi:hypothetical protein